MSQMFRGPAAVRHRLNDVPIIVLDGGMGSYLEDHYGVVFDESRPEWSSSADSETLKRVHSDYLDAGADVILTATYQALVDPIEQDFGSAREHRGDAEFWAGVRSKHVDSVPSWQKLRSLVNDAADVVDQKARLTPGTDPSRTPSTGPSLALSIGAYGATMKPSAEYTGIYKPPEMQNEGPLCLNFLQRIEPVYRSAVRSDTAPAQPYPEPWSRLSYVAFETLVSAPEVLAARRAMTAALTARGPSSHSGQFGHRLSGWWISVNYPDNSDSGLRAPCGEASEEIVRASLRPVRFGDGVGATLGRHPALNGMDGQTPLATPWGIGINCTKLYKLSALVQQYEDAVTRVFDESQDVGSDKQEWPWLVIYPDGAQNLRYNAETKTWDTIDRPSNGNDSKLGTESWATQMIQLLRDIGTRGKWRGIVVGGCCKTTPTDIAELVGLLEKN